MYERARVRALRGGRGWIVTHRNSEAWLESWCQAIRLANRWAQRSEDTCGIKERW